MEALWNQGQVSIREIQETFPKRTGPLTPRSKPPVYAWKPRKWFVDVKKSQFPKNIFEAAVSLNAAQRKLIDDLLALFGGSTQPVMAHLIESENSLSKMSRKPKNFSQTGTKGQIEMSLEPVVCLWTSIAPESATIYGNPHCCYRSGITDVGTAKNHARARIGSGFLPP